MGDKNQPQVVGPLRRIITSRGGEGSGHHGHEGRPGEVGGSLPSGEGEFKIEINLEHTRARIVELFGETKKQEAEWERRRQERLEINRFARVASKQLQGIANRLVKQIKIAKESDNDRLADAIQRRKDALEELGARREWYRIQRQIEALQEGLETGKLTLTESEMSKILATSGDVYADARMPRPYEYTPDLFLMSDISGRWIRHYVRLPDGRIAHPDELRLSRTRGNIIIIGKEREIPERDWTINRSITLVNRHYGPGPHPGTGTPQSVHGDGNGIKRPSHGDRASIPGSEVGSMVDWVNVQVLNVKGDEVEVEILSGPDISAFYTVALDDWEAYSSEFDDALGPTDDPVENAKLIFGLTDRYAEAGYILESGELLDFSGASQGSGGGKRYLDHRDIWQAFPNYVGSGYDAMIKFMAMGNIRMNFSMYKGEHDVSFDIAKLPTYAQKRVMKDMTQGAANLTWDITDPETGQEIASAGGSYPEERELAEMFETAVRKLVGRSIEFRYFTLRIRGEQPSHRIDARDIDYGWADKYKDEGIFTTPIEPKDGIIALPKASRGLSLEEPISSDVEIEPESENEEEKVEKKSLMGDIRRSFTELMAAIRRER